MGFGFLLFGLRQRQLQYAVRMGMIQDNPCRGGRVVLPKAPPTERDVYSLEEAQRFLESLDEAGSTVLDVNEEDQLLLLITCTGDDSERLVVSARRLRDGETEDSLHFRAN